MSAVDAAPRAHGDAVLTAAIRQDAEDFRVDELDAFTPSGQGEHLLLTIEKHGMNTQFVARLLATPDGERHLTDLEHPAELIQAEAEAYLQEKSERLHLRGRSEPVVVGQVADLVHVLPDVLQDGDLLSVDFAASLDGWVSDSAISFVVRELVDPSRCTSTLASPGCTTTPSCEIDICESSSPIVHDSPVRTLRAT